MPDEDIKKEGLENGEEPGDVEASRWDEGGREKSTQKIPSLADEDHHETLGKTYKVIRKIGEGGMGTVYEVEHIRMGKRFAAKLILEQYAKDKDAIKRLELEAIAASKIESSHIVQVVHMDTVDDYTFIIMELLKGRNLASVIRKKAVTVSLAVEIARQVATGLVAAHQADIIHRDLKPENIFLTEQDGKLVVKILDFGISKMLHGSMHDVSITKTGQLVGTPLYFSPEQARNSRGIDKRTDIYSLGIILYEMLTGEPAFLSSSPVELIYMHLSKPPPRPSKLNPEVDQKLEQVILKCLEKKPADRFQSVEEVLAELDKLAFGHVDTAELDFLTHAQIAAPQADTTKMGLSFSGNWNERKSRQLLFAFGATVLVLLVLAVLSFTTGFWNRLKSAGPVGPSSPPAEPLVEAQERGSTQPAAGSPRMALDAASGGVVKVPALAPPSVPDAGTDPGSVESVLETTELEKVRKVAPAKTPKKPYKVKPPAKTKAPEEKKPPAEEKTTSEPPDKPKTPAPDWSYP